jgi:hypothetical protein
MSSAVTGLLGMTICQQTPISSSVLCPMLSKHWVVDILTPAFPGSVCPINIPMRGNIRLFPKISLQRFLLTGCCNYCFDTLADVQWFWFKDKARGSSKINPMDVGRTVSIVLLGWNMVIRVTTDGYQIW